MPEPDDSTTSLLRFGVFELDLESGELRRSGRRVELASQPFAMLALVAEADGRPVSRDEICRHLWPEEVHVDLDQSINSCARQIRAALGDRSETPRYLETLPQQGYRFVAPIIRGRDSRSRSWPPSELVHSVPFGPGDIEPAASAQLAAETGVGKRFHTLLRPPRRPGWLAWLLLLLGLALILILLYFSRHRHTAQALGKSDEAAEFLSLNPERAGPARST